MQSRYFIQPILVTFNWIFNLQLLTEGVGVGVPVGLGERPGVLVGVAVGEGDKPGVLVGVGVGSGVQEVQAENELKQ